MSNPNHESEKRDLELYIKLFGYISILGRSEEVNLRQELDKEEKRFHRNLDRLAKCQSCFQEGIKFPSTNKESENGESIKENDHLTVLHKAITVFKLSRRKDGKRSSQESHHTNTKKLKIKQDNNGSVEETHHENALKCTVECKQKCAQQRVILFILEHYPKLLYCNRDNSTKFCGQTPLHMAITKENKYLVKMLLDYARNDKEHGVKELLSQSATGLSFKNNVMMGQLPLSVAVLTANKDIVKLLLQQSEIDVCQKNEDGDTLFHSLLKYAYVFLDREDDAKEMIELIKKEKNDCWKKLLLMENKSNDTPLTLAAKNGQIEMIHYILEEGYCSRDDSSGLFDVELYDMTDIDHELKEYRRQQDKKEMEEELNDMAKKSLPISHYDSGPSIFDLIFDHSYKTSLKFMQIRPIEWMIRKKWKHYSKFLYIGLILHLVLISFLTASAAERITSQATETLNQGLGAPFPTYFAIIMVIISPLYLWLGCFKIVQICRGKFQITRKPFSNPYANAAFHALFFIFALCIIIDLGLTWYTGYNNMSLSIAVVIGWFILLFFLRATRFFCFFTSLIQRILLQDITRFAPIIAIQLLGFSTAMFMFLYRPNVEDNKKYDSWWGMLMLTFQDFLGGESIEIAHSSDPVPFSIIYVTFIIMTTILMLNALIAILSSTCTDLLQNFTHDMHLHLQQLSVILFFEGLLPNFITQKYAREVTRKVDVYTFDKSRNMFRKMTRHLMRIYLVEEEGGNGGMVESSMFKLITDLYKKKTDNDESYQSNPSYSQRTSQENTKNATKYRQNTEHRNCRLDIHDLM